MSNENQKLPATRRSGAIDAVDKLLEHTVKEAFIGIHGYDLEIAKRCIVHLSALNLQPYALRYFGDQNAMRFTEYLDVAHNLDQFLDRLGAVFPRYRRGRPNIAIREAIGPRLG